MTTNGHTPDNVNGFNAELSNFFSAEEMLTIVEFARIAMGNSEIQEFIGIVMDVKDVELGRLAEKLANFMNRDTQENPA